MQLDFQTNFQIPFEKYIYHFTELACFQKDDIIEYYDMLQPKHFKRFLKELCPVLTNVSFWDFHFHALADFWNRIFKVKKKRLPENFKIFLIKTFYEICFYKMEKNPSFYFDKSSVKLLKSVYVSEKCYKLLYFLITHNQEKRCEFVEFCGMRIRKNIYRSYFQIQSLIFSFLRYEEPLYGLIFKFCLPDLDFTLDNRLQLLDIVSSLKFHNIEF